MFFVYGLLCCFLGVSVVVYVVVFLAMIVDDDYDDDDDDARETLQVVTLPSPFLLATTYLDPDTIINHILSGCHEYVEGSVWDLGAPTTPTWVAQLNQAIAI